LAFQVDGRREVDGMRELSDEEDIFIKIGGSEWRLENLLNKDIHDLSS